MHPADFAIIAAYLAAIVFMGFRLSQRGINSSVVVGGALRGGRRSPRPGAG